MARPQRITDEELLQAALECFLEHGANTSAQVIADRVGLSQPALFKRFGTKTELFLRAVCPPENLPVLDWLQANPSPGPFEPQLLLMLHEVWNTLIWVLPRIQLLQASRLPKQEVFSRYDTPPPQRLVRSLEGFFERAKRQGQLRSGVNPMLTAMLVFGTLMGRSMQQNMMPPTSGVDSDAEFLESTAEMLCRGLVQP